MVDFKVRSGWFKLEWWTYNVKSWQWNGGPKGEVYSLPFLGIKVCWLHWGLVWKLSRCRNSPRSHCCNPEVLYLINEVCICLFKGVSVSTGICGSGFVWQFVWRECWQLFILYSFWEVSEEATLILTHYWYQIVPQFPWMTLALDACTGHGYVVWWSGSGGQNRKWWFVSCSHKLNPAKKKMLKWF